MESILHRRVSPRGCRLMLHKRWCSMVSCRDIQGHDWLVLKDDTVLRSLKEIDIKTLVRGGVRKPLSDQPGSPKPK